MGLNLALTLLILVQLGDDLLELEVVLKSVAGHQDSVRQTLNQTYQLKSNIPCSQPTLSRTAVMLTTSIAVVHERAGEYNNARYNDCNLMKVINHHFAIASEDSFSIFFKPKCSLSTLLQFCWLPCQ